MTQRDRVMGLLKKMPPNSSYRAIIRKIEFVAGIEEGIREAKRREGIPIEEVREMMKGWIAKASSGRKARAKSRLSSKLKPVKKTPSS